MNKMSLNKDKTKYMVFHYRQRKLKDGDISKLKINKSEIERCRLFKFCGLAINEHMAWCSHIRNISNTISRVVGIKIG